jgi:gamma-glutamyltranspeptidase/glutathione hydrolase
MGGREILLPMREGCRRRMSESRGDFRMRRVSWKYLAVTSLLACVPVAFGQGRGQARSMVISKNGIVASESPLASQAGARILERGGNAVDAAIATNAMMGVVEPMMNGIGGDLFAIVYDAKANKLYGLNASGWGRRG